MITVIENGQIITSSEIIRDGRIVICDGRIVEVASCRGALPEQAEVIDAEGCYVSAGFIDLHTHGGGGCDFMDIDVDAWVTAAETHAAHGTTLLYPTTLTSTLELLYATFDNYDRAVAANHRGAAFGGLHLEGPYFAYGQRGAQDPRYLRNPEPEEYLAILERSHDIARWSSAPELPGTHAFGRELAKRGILASMAHTDATFEQAQAAFENGFTHLTHFYSCMSTVTRRNAFRYAGVLEFGYYEDGVTVEIIADGIHVPSSLLRLIRKIKGADRIALCTDSMRAAGMPEGPSVLGGKADGLPVIVEDGVAKLPDRTAFAGSVATADRLVRTMMSDGGASLVEAVRMMTATPARIMRIDDRKGSIRKGADADLTIFDDRIDVRKTILGGKTIYEKKQ